MLNRKKNTPISYNQFERKGTDYGNLAMISYGLIGNLLE